MAHDGDPGGFLSDDKLALLDALLDGVTGPDEPPIRRRSGPDAPLSFAQQRLWFLHQLDPRNPAYNVPFALEVSGRLDVDALRAALSDVVARHEVLRTTFTLRPGGDPVARVHPPTGVALPVEDLSDRPGAEQAARGLVAEHAARPFDLATGPLLRALLVRLAPDRHLLTVTFHHAVFDGWSVGVLVPELAELYRSRVDGDTPALPVLDVQYGDYAAWQRDALGGDALRDGLAYWRSVLSGAPAVLSLPTDRPRPPVPSYRGGRHPVVVSPALYGRVAALARRERASVFMVVLAAYALLLSRYSGQDDVVVGTPVAGRRTRQLEPLVGCFINTLALRTDLSGRPTFTELVARVRRAVLDGFAHEDVPFERVVDDLRPDRDLSYAPLFQAMLILNNQPAAAPRLPGASLRPVEVDVGTAKYDVELDLWEGPDGLTGWLEYNADLFDADTAGRMVAHLTALLDRATAAPHRPVDDLDLLGPAERVRVLPPRAASRTAPAGCAHDAIAAQAARTPDAVAVVRGGSSLTYAELDRRANLLAHRLRRHGAGPDRLVGVCTGRSVDTVVALLAVLRAGAGYLPLDSGYPADRLAFMLADARPVAVLVDGDGRRRLAGAVADGGPDLLDVAAPAGEPDPDADRPPATGVGPRNLAYAIYTSGSTGRPKGVLVEHRQVVNFFAGMDERLGTEPGVWLAVTSISFDISVLELLWTLARGYTVVVADAADLVPTPGGALRRRGMDFGLFYFASDDDAPHPDRYRLLVDGARFADANGFGAVWTPERHFHAFGGLYPNPAVTAAALAMVTERVHLRAGSVVVPLHHPVRVAEDWSVVDNLSGGRVGVSFASGWHADDFVLAPGNYAERRRVTAEAIETVRRLWRGEAVTLPGGTGAEVAVRIRPRPVQPELPVWLTAAGNPETFRAAGATGANLLTHLLGQDLPDLAAKIEVYRAARRQAGPGEGHVTLMLHAFVGDDDAAVRETVRGPFVEYLRGSLDLVRVMAQRMGEDVRPETLTADDLDALLHHAFDRYVGDSGLFGTPESCLDLVSRLADLGVDEVACLVDFGVDAGEVLANLPNLAELRRRANAHRLAEPADGAWDGSLPALVERYGVTHLQCTPSLARLLADNAATARALARLRVLLVGGEALPTDLAARLRAALPGRLLSMYGPTETTVWSAVEEVTADGTHGGGSASVHLGEPVLHTGLYVLDRRLRPVPVGVPGELYVAGAGVTRGYHRRPGLTAERYLPDLLDPGGRMYRTGDLVRRRADGGLEFLGRVDHQVKLRGFRVELGEIEAAVAEHPGVGACVVTARGRPGEQTLVCYVTRAEPSAGPLRESLVESLRRRLPDHMVPRVVVELDALPLTPNGKVDRAALPEPPRGDAGRPAVAPRDPVEAALAGVFADVLGVDGVGVHDNFFELGGDSILVIRAVDKAAQRGVRLTPRLLFAHQTVAELARAALPAGPAPALYQGEVTGSVPLTPMQRWFFDQELPEPHHYNHAMLLECPRPLERSALDGALRALLAHHDALRMRFRRGPDGWEQEVGPIDPDAPAPLAWVSAADLPADGQPALVASVAAEVQAGFDLADGPLLRACYVDCGGRRPDRLLLVVHHLVVDGVSGRLLVEDLWTAYEQLERGAPVVLPAKTAPFRDWAARLVERARDPRLAADAAHWLGLPWHLVRPLPLDHPDGTNTEASERHLTVGLDRDETRALLRGATGGGPAHVDEVILAALALAVSRWAGGGAVLVDLEGHGRDVTDLDVSRTAGWFTSVHPVLVECPTPGADVVTLAAEVRRRLRGAPDRGAGFGLLRYLAPDDGLRRALADLRRAQIIVNYLGQFDGSLGPFGLADEPAGPYRSPLGTRSHLLVLNGYVTGGRLRVDWGYSAALHDEATVRALADDFAAGLREAVRRLGARR